MDGLKGISITIAMFMSIAIVIAATHSWRWRQWWNGQTLFGHLGIITSPFQCQTGIDK
jgi:hypothetical protein